jgi:hypothetical protein
VSKQRPCEATRQDGTPCRGNSRPGSRWCWAHDPGLKEKRDAARRKGGRERSKAAAVLPQDAPDLPLGTVGEVVKALAATVNQVRKGALDVKAANCVGYLLSVMLRALEGSELQRQLDELRAELEQMKGAAYGHAGELGPAAGPGEGRGSPAEGGGAVLAPGAAGARA